MNITDGGMMGFNFSRKKNNNVVRIRQSSWLSYIEALEACLESDEEKIILQNHQMNGLNSIIEAGRDYAFNNPGL